MKIKLLLNCDLKNHKKGSVINIKTDDDYIPVDLYWKRRLEDSKIDNCVNIYNDNLTKEQTILYRRF